jgi:hypothetical protein
VDREDQEFEDDKWFSDRVPVFRPHDKEYEETRLFKWEKLTAIGNGLLAALAALVTAFSGSIALWQTGLLEQVRFGQTAIKKEIGEIKTDVKNINTKVERHYIEYPFKNQRSNSKP